MYHEIPEPLLALVEPVIAAHGCELVDLEFADNPRAPTLRIVIDTPAGDGRVPVERCAQVSREIATVLDAESDLPPDYRLEVASPGLDRVLSREKDFRAACGREIRLETRLALDGRKRFRGCLRSFEGGMVRLGIDGRDLEIPLGEVKRANQVYEFSSADFSGGESRRSKRRRASRSARSGEIG
jgi:ribosome maturation factor RimP